MRTPVLLWLVLAGATAALRCPGGRLCPAAPSLPMLPAESASAAAGSACPDGSWCPHGSSCLRTGPGAFGCCPLVEGISCSRGHRCCPRGSHCSADGSSCIAHLALGAVQCPDGESECPESSTCCVMPSGAWGCCPMPEALCCPDKVHCCPRATVCDLAHDRCLAPAGQHPLGTKFPARKHQSQPWLPVALGQVTCPDGRSACPDGATCCQLPSGHYGCCPLQNAVCCSDHLHCCPQGTACDLEHSKCSSMPGPTAPLTHLVAATTARVVWCDEWVSCPDGNTCCQLSSGKWGCCPLEQAVCCLDHVHCCPQGYTCDPEGGSCLQGGVRVPWHEKTPARTAVGDIKCDDEMSCPDGNTCCQLSSGKWGCCPLEQAVCCPDHVHCCPHGYTCDPEGGSCLQGGFRVPWHEKTPARTAVRDIKCDDEMSCPDGNTCCQLSSGKWGCCPLEQAVCCPDHVHCCPHGYTCDPEGGSCLQGGIHMPWHKKTPAQTAIGDIKCDDEMSCPDGNTCCQLSSDKWGCCPLEQAVCCPDHVHCCPQGYTCDPKGGSCLQGGVRVPWHEKTSARMVVRDVKCDDEMSCPDGNTCCQLSSGKWGCCPLEQAVCCSDGIHCCPLGFSCDQAHGTCYQGQPAVLPSPAVPWVPKVPVSRWGQAVKCNATASCADGQTCCRSRSGDWACCQLPSAVCCKDREHCCPWGYTCNVAAHSCEKQRPRKQPAATALQGTREPPAPTALQGTREPPTAAVPCDAAHSCRGGQKCCAGPHGTWGCCPFAEGSCCSDGSHCCPPGSLCGLGSCRPLRWDVAAAAPTQKLL